MYYKPLAIRRLFLKRPQANLLRPHGQGHFAAVFNAQSTRLQLLLSTWCIHNRLYYPRWWFYLEGISCSIGGSTGSPECSPRSLRLGISKFQYLPILLRSLKSVSISPDSQGLFPAKPSEVFSCACAGGSHPKNWSKFCFGKYSQLLFCRYLLFITCPQMPWKTSILSLCSSLCPISLHHSFEKCLEGKSQNGCESPVVCLFSQGP